MTFNLRSIESKYYDESVVVFAFCRSVYTLSTLDKPSKNGIKSKSSVSVISSNHDRTGT